MLNKKKILFILHLPPPIHGSSVMGDYIKLSSDINEAFDCRYVNLGTSESIGDIGKIGFKKLFKYVSLIWEVEKQLFFFRPNLCYLTISSNGPGFFKDTLIVLLVRIFVVKLVYHFHNKGVSAKQNKVINNLLYRFVFRKVDVILLSKHLYTDIWKYVPENRTHYCPNGIADLEDKRQKIKVNSTDTIEILFLSHLFESKGIYVLVEALKMLKDKDIDFHCTIIGEEGNISEGQLRSKIEKAGLDNSILVEGKKFGEGKRTAWERAEIFVLPTFYHNECMPLVILEAMKQSLPVVSTFEGAISDVVEDGKTGFLVPQRDSTALAEKLELLIKNPGLRTRMGAAGRNKYAKEFSLATFSLRLMEILKEITVNSE
jgi:glycosyltransferase involved in cell wall biosynthesis